MRRDSDAVTVKCPACGRTNRVVWRRMAIARCGKCGILLQMTRHQADQELQRRVAATPEESSVVLRMGRLRLMIHHMYLVVAVFITILMAGRLILLIPSVNNYWNEVLKPRGREMLYTPGPGQSHVSSDNGRINASLGGRRLFPPDNAWNQRVDDQPVDPRSLLIIREIGADQRLHPDFAARYRGQPVGIPYIVVPGSTPRVKVRYIQYPDESDPGPFPIPPDAPIEGFGQRQSDRHLIVLDRDNWKLYELFNAEREGFWFRADSGAEWDLNSNKTRPAGWTSADAAGLPILPGLVRYDEVSQGAINHALRFTVSRSRAAYVAPASHWASRHTDPFLPPMGMRVRLRASFDISGLPRTARIVARALQQYGMILADNGGNWFLSGSADTRWNDVEVRALRRIRGADFEVIRMPAQTDATSSRLR